MTDWEKAVVMAYTGVCLLQGEKFGIFHRYIEEKLGRPVWTHELGSVEIEQEVKAAAKQDFFAVCADAVSDNDLHKYDDMTPTTTKGRESDMNVYIIGNLNDAMTDDELEKTIDQYREAENQLAAFGFGVLSPHHLPADLRGIKGASIILSMIQAADICYAIDYPTATSPSRDFEMAELLRKVVYLPDSLYEPDGNLRKLMGVEEIDEAKEA